MTATTPTLPTFAFLDNTGKPASGGTLTIYDANTVTPAVTWQDKAQATANANPLTLNSRGECTVWLEAGKFYDFLVKDSLGSIISNQLNVSGATSAVTAPSAWVVTAIAPTFVTTRSFTVVGDQTATFIVGRRLRLTSSLPSVKYGTVLSSVFSTVTTIVVGFQNSTDVLDAGLSAVDVGLDDVVNSPFPTGAASVINMTGYSGSDVPLSIGQVAVYDLAAVTVLALRIATGDSQQYEIDALFTTASAGATLAQALLQPNNTAQSGIYVSNFNTIQTGVGTSSVSGNNQTNINQFVLGAGGGREYRYRASITTKLSTKTVFAEYFHNNATGIVHGSSYQVWLNQATAWTSLGTITHAEAKTGRIQVRRVA